MFSNRLVPSFLLALATTLPFSYSAPFDEQVQTLIESQIAASNDHPTLDIRVDDEYSQLQSHNANGDEEGQKRPYGLLGPGDVEFKFYEPEDYKQETFRVSYFEPPATSAGYQVDDAWETHSATKIIECIASVTASPTASATVKPSEGLTNTTDGLYQVKCTGV